MVFAKSPEMQRLMKSHWRDNGVSYVCLCEGRPDMMSGEFQVNREDGGENKNDNDNDERQGDKKLDVFRYRVLQSSSKDRDMCLLEIYPEPKQCIHIISTLANGGCRVVGGTEDSMSKSALNPLRRLGMHANEVKLRHPLSRELVTIKSPTPVNFERMIHQNKLSSVEYSVAVDDTDDDDDDNDDDNDFIAPKNIKVVTVHEYLNTGSNNSQRSHSSSSSSSSRRRRRGRSKDIRK